MAVVVCAGLTVALFVAGEAFQHEKLQGEAKLGALLSGGMGFVCVAVSKLHCHKSAAFMRIRRHKTRDLEAVHRGTATTSEMSEYVTPVAAAKQIGYGNNAFIKHLIRAGDNQLPCHPTEMSAPRLLSVDPDAAHLRARQKWAVLRKTHVATASAKELSEMSIAEKSAHVVNVFRQTSSKRSMVAPMPVDPSPLAASKPLDPSPPTPDVGADAVTVVEPIALDPANADGPTPEEDGGADGTVVTSMPDS